MGKNRCPSTWTGGRKKYALFKKENGGSRHDHGMKPRLIGDIFRTDF